MLSPSSWISPAVRTPGMSSLRRLIDRRKVDFPHPEGPINAVIDREGMVRVISLSACFSPYQNEKPVEWMRPGWGDCGARASDRASETSRASALDVRFEIGR